MESPTTRQEENVFTLSANRYFDEREKKWVKRDNVQTLWNWTFAILFTLVLAVLALVAKSFKESNENQIQSIAVQKEQTREIARSADELRVYLAEKKQEDVKLAKEYRQNMESWKNEDNNGKIKTIRK